MTATFTVDGANTTIDFAYTKPTATVQAIVTAAAHHLWLVQGGNGTFESLNNQQKLNLVDAHLKRVIQALAKQYSVDVAQNTARDAAIIDADTNLVL